MDNNIDTLTHRHYKIKELQNNISIKINDSWTIIQLWKKLYYEDLIFKGVNPLYTLAKKHDKTITKEFESNWLKNQSTQQQTM